MTRPTARLRYRTGAGVTLASADAYVLDGVRIRSGAGQAGDVSCVRVIKGSVTFLNCVLTPAASGLNARAMPSFATHREDWCWRLADGRVWSTKAAAFVGEDAQAAWLEASGLTAIPPSPVDEEGGSTRAGLRQALVFYGLALGGLMTPEEQLAATQAAFTAAIQARLDTFAQTRMWDDAKSCALRSTSAVERYRIEGRYMLDAMDAAWDIATTVLNAVLAGDRPMMTLDEVLAELPTLAWPDAGE